MNSLFDDLEGDLETLPEPPKEKSGEIPDTTKMTERERLLWRRGEFVAQVKRDHWTFCDLEPWEDEDFYVRRITEFRQEIKEIDERLRALPPAGEPVTP